MNTTANPTPKQPWRPRPKRSSGVVPVFVGALLLASLALCGFAIYLAWDAERQRKQFDQAMDGLDAQRVTPKEIASARVGEEIAVQIPRPAPAGIVVPVTFYGEEYRGRLMANGKPFDPDAMTCAHRTLKLGTMVEFNQDDTPPLVLEVTDRGPWDKHPAGHPKAGQYRKEFDLSAAAFRVLSPDMSGGEGLPVRVRVVR